MEEQKPKLAELMSDFPAYAAYVHIVTKDGKKMSLRLNRLQRAIWNKIQQNIKNGTVPCCSVLKRWRTR